MGLQTGSLRPERRVRAFSARTAREQKLFLIGIHPNSDTNNATQFNLLSGMD